MSWNQSEWASSLLSSTALLALALCVADPGVADPVEPRVVLAAPLAPPTAAAGLEASDVNTQPAQTQDSGLARELAARGDEILER